MHRRKHDYVNDALVPVGGVPVSVSSQEDGEFLVTDLPNGAPLDPSTFPVLTRDLSCT